VAVALKLLIALWRFLETGALPIFRIPQLTVV